jgi:hypothetical protein
MARGREAKRTRSWPVACQCLAAGTVRIYAAVASRIVSVAAARQVPSRPNNGEGPTRTLQFNIGPGMLEVALAAFENATELHVIVPDPKTRHVIQERNATTPRDTLRNVVGNGPAHGWPSAFAGQTGPLLPAGMAAV